MIVAWTSAGYSTSTYYINDRLLWTVMYLWVPHKVGNFLTSWMAICFSIRILFHGLSWSECKKCLKFYEGQQFHVSGTIQKLNAFATPSEPQHICIGYLMYEYEWTHKQTKLHEHLHSSLLQVKVKWRHKWEWRRSSMPLQLYPPPHPLGRGLGWPQNWSECSVEEKYLALLGTEHGPSSL
jgi:hypothetical protein